MSTVAVDQEVLTLPEAAEWLRVSEDMVRRLMMEQGLPGRRVGREWRFLKAALRDWLRGRPAKDVLLHQAGALAEDPYLPEMLEKIYRDRGRSEIETG